MDKNQTQKLENSQILSDSTPIKSDSNQNHHKFLKIFSIIFLILVVLSLGAVYAFPLLRTAPLQKETVKKPPSPTPDPMRDWRKYRNEKIGFEFQYPSKWYFSTCDTSDPIITLSDTKIECQTEPWNYPINLHVSSLTADKFDAYKNNGSFVSQRSLSLNGKEIEQVFIDYRKKKEVDIPLYFTATHFKGEKNTIDIEYYGYDYRTGENKIYNQILSTFKFLDNQQVFKKRFFNPQGSFSKNIKYPTELVVPEDKLIGLSCTPKYDKGGDLEPVYEYENNQELTDSSLLSLVSKAKENTYNKKVSEVMFCATEDGRKLMEYESHGGNGGEDSTAYISQINSKNELEHTIKFPSGMREYPTCSILELTTSDDLYLFCDGTYNSAIYKTNLSSNTLNTIISCSTTSIDDNGGAVIACK